MVSRARAWIADMAMVGLGLVVLLIICVAVAPVILWRMARGLRA